MSVGEMSRNRCKSLPEAHLVVVERVVHRDVPLHGDAHRHEDGGRHGDGHSGKEEVRKEDHVHGRRQPEALPEALQDRPDEVP